MSRKDGEEKEEKRGRRRLVKNKAVYTTASVVCKWAGSVKQVAFTVCPKKKPKSKMLGTD